jgi:hypothetical protein
MSRIQFGFGNQRLDVHSQSLCFGNRRIDPFVTDQGVCQVGQQRLAVRCLPAKVVNFFVMSHNYVILNFCFQVKNRSSFAGSPDQTRYCRSSG